MVGLRENGRTALCQNNLRQLAIGGQQYLQDNGVENALKSKQRFRLGSTLMIGQKAMTKFCGANDKRLKSTSELAPTSSKIFGGIARATAPRGLYDELNFFDIVPNIQLRRHT